MTQLTAPTLDELRDAAAPAWLWDGHRLRIVWANDAGVAYFGLESLFDLVDMPFDKTDPGVGRIADLSRQVRPGESWRETLSFASATDPEAFDATFHVHMLADGRTGILVVADLPSTQPQDAPSDGMAHRTLETLPLPVMTCRQDGRIVLANEAARAIWAGQLPATLQDKCPGDAIVQLFERALRAGVASITANAETEVGVRDFRFVARLVEPGDTQAATNAVFTVILDDITERKALERQLAGPGEEASHTRQVRLAGQQAQADAPAPAPAQTKSAPAENLEAVRRAIEDASGQLAQPGETEPAHDETAAPGPPELTGEYRAGFDVPDIVRRALAPVPKAVVLFRAGQLAFANPAAQKLLGYEAEAEMAARHDIATAAGTVEGRAGTVKLPDKHGHDLDLLVERSTFPWQDGAIPLAILSPRPAAGEHEDEEVVKLFPGSRDRGERAGASPAEDPDHENADPAHGTASKTSIQTPDEAAREGSPSLVKPAAADTELMAILDTASDGIMFLDGSGLITHVSAGAEALFGVHSANVLDTPLADLMEKKSAKVVRDYIAALDDSSLSNVFNDGREVTGQLPDGTEVPLFLTIRKLDKAALGLASRHTFCAVLRDITQWKKTEQDLRSARDLAQQQNRDKSEFLARISHELRTPLNAIIGFSDVMRKGQFGNIGNERYEGYANDIHASGEYLLSLVNDLLDLSKVEAGKLELNFTSVDLGQIIDSCVKLMQDEATGARVILRTSVSADLPHVVADTRSIKQVLLNLTSNAIKFTDPGGQVIVAAKMLDSGELRLSVSDTGVGMNESELAMALRPFQRVETTGRPEVQGTGLGLPLTKALVEANRARFEISSKQRKGTRVDITFPTTRVLAG